MNVEFLKLEGKMIVTVSKIDNGYVVTLIEPPKQPVRKAPTEGEINKKIGEMVRGIIEFNRAMGQLTKDDDAGESWKQEGGGKVGLPKLVEHFKAMNPNMVEEMKEMMCPQTPRIEKMVFTEMKDLLNYLASNL